MNLYIRYFNQEILAHNADEAIDFLNSIPEVKIENSMQKDLRSFAESSVAYPKRYKLAPKIYFIVIKTTAETMEEFKSNNRKSNQSVTGQIKSEKQMELNEDKPGWYEGSLLFKRVIPIPGTGKFQYRDTPFVARVKAHSPQECYMRIIQHLRNRQDVDLRSQFPSSKGKNFTYKYLGETLPPR